MFENNCLPFDSYIRQNFTQMPRTHAKTVLLYFVNRVQLGIVFQKSQKYFALTIKSYMNPHRPVKSYTDPS